jgi:RNA polymerase sigma factor (sigma-70 family)
LTAAAKNDGELLAEFARAGSAAAFEELVRRHSGLVLGVCERLLGPGPDVEDAAQAVFMTLAHKARALSGRCSVAGWLHHVARHVALRAGEAAAVRRRHEKEAGEMIDRARDRGSAWTRLRPELDRALNALPEKYRLPLILHHMEGRTQEEVAGLLGTRTGTVSARLSRGRQMLRDRLGARGVVVGSAALIGLLGENALGSASGSFLSSTSRAATLFAAGKAAAAGAISAQVAALTEGVLKAMFIARLKTAAAITAAAALLAGGAGIAVHGVVAGEKQRATRPAGRKAVPATANGMEIALSPAKTAFGHQDGLRFVVAYKNVSKKQLSLAWTEGIGGRGAAGITDASLTEQKSGKVWRLGKASRPGPMPGAPVRMTVKKLAPGASAKGGFGLPGFGRGFWNGKQELRSLPPGKYVLSCKLVGRNAAAGQWKGEVRISTVAFWVAPKLADPAKFAKAPAVLRVRRVGVGGGSKYSWDSVKVLEVMKNESSQQLGKDSEPLKVAHYGWKAGVPDGESTIYLEPYNAEKNHPWKLLNADGGEGVSHSAKADAALEKKSLEAAKAFVLERAAEYKKATRRHSFWVEQGPKSFLARPPKVVFRRGTTITYCFEATSDVPAGSMSIQVTVKDGEVISKRPGFVFSNARVGPKPAPAPAPVPR